MFAFLDTTESPFAFISQDSFKPYNDKGTEYVCPVNGQKLDLTTIDTGPVVFEEGSHGEELDEFFFEYLKKNFGLTHIWIQELHDHFHKVEDWSKCDF